MVKGHGKEMNNQRGSATIEAVIGFTAFLFAIFTILGLVNFCRAQMLVSSAVDTAAKELSQYAYFYEMSGLQKFEGKLDKNASVGKNNINEIIGTVDKLYSSINGAVDQTIQEKTNVENMMAAGKVDMQTLENAITGIENSVEGVKQGIAGVSNMIGDIGNDPLIYMRSIVALIGSEGMEAAKRVVAVPLARAFVSKYLGEDTDAANAKLKSLGIEGGLDSMNFNLSKFFSDDKHQDIEITVFYKVKLLQVFDWVVLEANVSKVASCRAWLGGDDVITKAVATNQPSLGLESPSAEDENTESADTKEETAEPSEEKVDTTGSYWHLDANGKYTAVLTGSYGSGVGRDFLHHLAPVNGVPIQPTQSTPENLKTDNPKQLFQSYTIVKGNDDTDSSIYIGILNSMKVIEENLEAYDTEDVERTLYYEVYVPDNISEEDYKKIEEEIEEAKEKLDQSIDAMNSEDNTTGMTTAKNADYEIRIIKSGGNYDYSSGGT